MPQSSIQLPPALLSLLLSSSSNMQPGNGPDCAADQRRNPIPSPADRPTSYIPMKSDKFGAILDSPTTRVNPAAIDIPNNAVTNSYAFVSAPPTSTVPRLLPCTTNSQPPTATSPLLQLLLQQGGIPQQPQQSQPPAPLAAPVQAPPPAPPRPTALPQSAMPPPMSAPAAVPEAAPMPAPHSSASDAAVPFNNTQLLYSVVNALLAQSQGQPVAPPQPVPSAAAPLVSTAPAAPQVFSVPHSTASPPPQVPAALHAAPQAAPVPCTPQPLPTPCEAAVRSASAQMSSEQFSEQSASDSAPRDLATPTVDSALLQALLAAQTLQAQGNPTPTVPVGGPQASLARMPQGPMHTVLQQREPVCSAPSPSVAAAAVAAAAALHQPAPTPAPVPPPRSESQRTQQHTEPSPDVKLLLGILAQHAQKEGQQAATQALQPPPAAIATVPQPQPQPAPPARLNPLQAPAAKHAPHALPQDSTSQPSLAHVLAQTLRATRRPPNSVAVGPVGSPTSSITAAAPPLTALKPQHTTAHPARSAAPTLQSNSAVTRPHPPRNSVASPRKPSTHPTPASTTKQDEQHVSSLTALLKTLQSCAKDDPEPVHTKHALPQQRGTAARGTHAVQRGSVQKPQHTSKPTRPRSRLSQEKKGDAGATHTTQPLAARTGPSPTNATDMTAAPSLGKKPSLQCVAEPIKERVITAPARQAAACMSPKQMLATAASGTEATEGHPLKETAAPDNALGGFAAAVLAATGAVRGAHRRVPSSPGAMHEHHESAAELLEGSSDLTRRLSSSNKTEAAPSPGPAGSSHKRSRFDLDDPPSVAAASPTHPHKRNTLSHHTLASADSAQAGTTSPANSHLGEYLNASKPSAFAVVTAGAGMSPSAAQAPPREQKKRGAPKFWKQRLSRRASTGALRLTPDGGAQGRAPRKRAKIQCKELRRVQSAEPTAVSRPGKHPMHEAEATILQMFAKRGYKGACLKGRLLAQAVVHRRLGVLLPPSACSDSMHGCVVHHDNLPTPGNVVNIQGCATEEEAEGKAIDALLVCHRLSEQGISGPRVVAELQRRGLCSIPLESTSQERAACMQSMD